MVIEFDIVDVEIASTNEMYMPRPKRGKNGRMTAYVTKTTKMRDFEKLSDPIIEEAITDEMVSELKNEFEDPRRVMRLDITYNLPSKAFFTSDTSNYVKTIEDRIKERLGVDDARNCEVNLRKVLSDSLSTHIVIETYDLEGDIPNKWPKKVKRGK